MGSPVPTTPAAAGQKRAAEPVPADLQHLVAGGSEGALEGAGGGASVDWGISDAYKPNPNQPQQKQARVGMTSAQAAAARAAGAPAAAAAPRPAPTAAAAAAAGHRVYVSKLKPAATEALVPPPFAPNLRPSPSPSSRPKPSPSPNPHPNANLNPKPKPHPNPIPLTL
jgi:hypothetical protein